MNLSKFIEEFNWESDGFVDSYHILKEGESGDCDDFASTVSYIESGSSKTRMFFNILTGKHRFYWCRSPRGEAHAILRVKGKGYIDNIFPTYRNKPEGHTKVVYLFWVPFLKLLIGMIDKT